MSISIDFDALRYVLLQLNENDRLPMRLVCKLYNDVILSTVINNHVHRLINNGNVFSAYYHISRPRKLRTPGVSIHYKLIIKNALRNGHTGLIKYMSEFRSLVRNPWMFRFLERLNKDHRDKMMIFLLKNTKGCYPNLQSMIIQKRSSIVAEMFAQGYIESNNSLEESIYNLRDDSTIDGEKIIDILIHNHDRFVNKTPITANWSFNPELVRKLYPIYSDNERRMLYSHIVKHNKELLNDCTRCVEVYNDIVKTTICYIKKELDIENIPARIIDDKSNLFKLDLSYPIDYSYFITIERRYNSPTGSTIDDFVAETCLYNVKPENLKKYKILKIVLYNIHNK